MNAPTRTDPTAPHEWLIDDPVIHLREWGTERIHVLPDVTECLLGADPSCHLPLVDEPRWISRRHARVTRAQRGATIEDVGSKNGLWIDDARRLSAALVPGIEIGIGALRMVAESNALIDLRAFVARLIGWRDEQRAAVDEALRAVRAATTLRAPLVLRGDGNLITIARELHRRTLGDRPFVVVDPRHRGTEGLIADVIDRARGGTVCVWASRLPVDFDGTASRLRARDLRIRTIICSREVPRVAQSMSVTPIAEREDDIARIIDECAEDAIRRLGAKPTSFTPNEREWIRRRQPASIAEIMRSAERVVALLEWGTLTNAAKQLGISHVALSRWLERKR